MKEVLAGMAKWLNIVAQAPACPADKSDIQQYLMTAKNRYERDYFINES